MNRVESNVMSKALARAVALSATMGVGLMCASQASATVTYNTWSSNDTTSANYILTVTDTGATNLFNWNITVNPWNAELLGLFVDLGDVAMPGAYDTLAELNAALTNVLPAGQVEVVHVDEATNDCGTGCNINGGVPVPALGGGDWELVFRLATTGYQGIQTFSWTTPDFGLSEASFGTVAVRAQVLCPSGSLLPADQNSCTGSDKSVGSPSSTSTSTSTSTSNGGGPGSIPEPGTLALLGIGMVAGAMRWRRSKQAHA